MTMITSANQQHLKAALLTVTPTQQAAADALAAGATHAEAATASGVARETVSRWAGHHPGFRSYLTEVRAVLAAELAEAQAERLRAIRDSALDALADRLTDGATITEALAVLRAIPDPGPAVPAMPPSPVVAAELLDRERDRLRPSLPVVPVDLLNDDPFAWRPTDHQRAEALAVERLALASGILGTEADQ